MTRTGNKRTNVDFKNGGPAKVMSSPAPCTWGSPPCYSLFRGKQTLEVSLTPFLGAALALWPYPEMASITICPRSRQAEEGDTEMAPRSLSQSPQTLSLRPSGFGSCSFPTAAPLQGMGTFSWGMRRRGRESAACDEGSSRHTTC